MKKLNKGYFKKEHIPWNKDLKGIHLSPKSEFKKGEKSAFAGRKHSQKSKEKMCRAHKGKSSGVKGKHWKLSNEIKKRMSLAKGGTGITQKLLTKRYYHLKDWKYKRWRSQVFERDIWTCQTCGKRGCYLEPHHIKGWAKYPKLRYKIDNGVALCQKCHKLIHKYARKKA